MKMEELMAPCPKCGSKNKTQHRDFDKEFRAYAASGELKCSDCGHIFKTRDEMIDERRKEEKENE
ncbi:MAG: TIGR04165 family Cys-rich peptide [Methanobacteriaceae archaeon]|nr:TIGR04165 family Cys-rich peptide [Methanobacteriaceae archaeon]